MKKLNCGILKTQHNIIKEQLLLNKYDIITNYFKT